MNRLIPILAFLALTSPLAAHAANNTLIVNTGSSMSCTTAKGESGFNVTAFSFGGTSNVSGGTGSGAGVGKPSLSDFTLTKTFDACSEALIKGFLAGTHFATVTLTEFHNAESRSVPILTITLKSVLINSYSLSGSTTLNPTETIGLAFNDICVANTAMNADGSTGATTTVCYNVAQNKVN